MIVYKFAARTSYQGFLTNASNCNELAFEKKKELNKICALT
jgi:hypothetical protein